MGTNNLTTNEKETLNIIRQQGPLSKVDLSKIKDISITNSGNLIKKLNKYNLLEQTFGQSTGGRKPTLYRLKDKLSYAMAIEIDFQSIHVIITDINNNILVSKKNTEPIEEIRDLKIKDVINLGYDALKSINFSWDKISTIGIGIIGIVDEKKGVCRLLPNTPSWLDLNVVDLFKKETGVKNVFLTDVVRAMALLESKIGLGKKLSSFLLIYLGIGMGAGIVIDKKVIKGFNGISGEFGHIKVSQSNEICVCGNLGCLESVASGWAIIKRAKKAIADGVYTSMTNLISTKKDLLLSDIIEAALKDDKLALNLILTAADYISSGISTIINLLDPDAIILTGELILKSENLLLNVLKNGIRAKILPWLTEDINVCKSKLGENTGVIGLSAYAIDNSFYNVISK